eukprot:Hpha_TRINITY_DN13457_c0_g2::TRINITY_DN13457_c0_g2_i1::g.131195::m.131195
MGKNRAVLLLVLAGAVLEVQGGDPNFAAVSVPGAGSGRNPCFRAPAGTPVVSVHQIANLTYAVNSSGVMWGVFRNQEGTVIDPPQGPPPLPRTRFALYVPSGVGMGDRRVRQRAWMKHQKEFTNASLIVTRFAIGIQPDPAAAKKATAKEVQDHGDLVLLDCTDLDVPGRSATAEKVLMSLHHAVRTLRFDWFLRGADDAWLQLGPLQWLYAVHGRKPRVYAGMILRRKPNVGPMRGHWPRGFLPYASGLGYVIGADLAALLASRLHDPASCLNVAWPEDAASGYWVQPYYPASIHNTAAFADYDHKDWCMHTVAMLHKPTDGAWNSLTECGRPIKCDAPPGVFLKQIGWGGPWMGVKCKGRTTGRRMVRGRRR